MTTPVKRKVSRSGQSGKGMVGGNVRFGSQADVRTAKRHVRFTPDSDHESDFSQTHVCFDPKSGRVQRTRLCRLRARSGHIDIRIGYCVGRD